MVIDSRHTEEHSQRLKDHQSRVGLRGAQIARNFDRPTRMMRFLLQSPLSAALKRKVLRTEILLVAQRLRNLRRRSGLHKSDIVQSRILDFDVAAYSSYPLLFMYEQIFRDHEYFFRSERADPFIVDAGSNIGMSILFFKALYPEARIIGFEPNPQAYALLKRNVDSNGLTGVQVHHAALGLEDATVDFFVDPEYPTSLNASTNRKMMDANMSPTKRTTVQQVRLSTFIDREVDLLKLDVEGAEDAVLKDLISSEVIYDVDQIILEYDHHVDKNCDKLGGFLSQIEESCFGYQISNQFQDEDRLKISARMTRGTYQTLLVYAYQKSLSSAVSTS
jgi:FkbM family methyltransferase